MKKENGQDDQRRVNDCHLTLGQAEVAWTKTKSSAEEARRMKIARHGGLSENSNVTCDVVETRRVVFQGSKSSSHRHSGASERKLCSMGRT